MFLLLTNNTFHPPCGQRNWTSRVLQSTPRPGLQEISSLVQVRVLPCWSKLLIHVLLDSLLTLHLISRGSLQMVVYKVRENAIDTRWICMDKNIYQNNLFDMSHSFKNLDKIQAAPLQIISHCMLSFPIEIIFKSKPYHYLMNCWHAC